jgi:HPt (histidine-containing phosphotransfer) domain-containing protein
MIDRIKFKENFQYFDKDIIIEIIDIFESEYEERFTKIEKNILEKDFVQLKFNAHSLKGVIANFMDPVTIDLSRTLDEVAKTKEGTGLQELFTQLKSSCDSLLEELRQIRKEFTS